MSSDSAPSPDHSSPPSPDSSSSSPSPKESPNESPPAKPPSSPPPSSPPPSAPPPSSPPPSSPPPSSPPPPKDSAPKGSSSPPPPKGASSSPPPPKEATPASSPPPPKEPAAKSPPAVPTPPAAVSEENDTAAATTPPHARPKTSPTGALSPPSHGSSTPSTDSSDEDSSSSTDNKGKIAGVAIGASLVIIVLLVVCVVCIRRKRRKRREMQYYGDPAVHHKGGGAYYNNTQQQNWHDMNNPQGDHVVRLNNQAPGGGAWPSGPPPMSDEASTNFSGPRGAPLPPPSPPMSLGFNKSTFTYDELAAATNGFSEANLLGQGGFGFVHKGVLPNGKEVAVKSLKSGSGQGEREFAAEVEIISRVHHRHLVSLVGYCIAGGQRMLVYEFVENKTMEYHLHGKGLPPMDWPTRLRIAVGSAKGLAYLHEDCHPKIIHRDIKSANILLDFNFEAMVADFGLAKLSSDNYTHVSTRVMGTFGYLAPEYASSGKLTEKSDVFSFGVMLLELITGKRPVDPSNAMDDSLVDWARPLLNRALEEGNNLELVDIRLDNNFNLQEMARMVACAAASIRHSARKRPKMSQIVRALEGDVSLDDLNEGTKPRQSSMFNAATGGGSSDYDTQAYNADMKKFRKLALSSQEFGSSEFGTSSNDSREMAGTPKNPKQQFL